jgi:ankyrin repeat protein
MEFVCFHDTSMKNCPCKFINTNNSIFTAASSGDLVSVKRSIEKQGVNNFQLKLDAYGYSAIHYAAQHNYPEILSYILSTREGIDVDKNSCGASPLLRAAYNGSVECVEILLKHGSNVNAIDVSFGDRRTSLHKAASRCVNKAKCDCDCKFHQIINLILTYNPDTTIRDKDNKLWSDLLEDIEDQETKLKPSTEIRKANESSIPVQETKITSNLPLCYVCNEAKFAFSKRRDGKLVCIACSNDL